MSRYAAVSIGNGIFARAKVRMSLMDEYRAKQAGCSHVKRDPRGACYDCGHVESAAAIERQAREICSIADELRAELAALDAAEGVR